MPFTAIIPVEDGNALLGVSNIRRVGEWGRSNVASQSRSEDGGLTWSHWRVILDIGTEFFPCEPELIRSPNGKQLLMIIRENNRAFNSWLLVSNNIGKEGVIFEKAYVTQAGCSPSRASIFTGSFPHENGQIGLATHGFRLYEKNTFNFFNALKESGYRTAILGKIHVNPESAFNLDARLEGDSFGKRNVQKVATIAMNFITESSQPFFLMVNYADAHRPFIKQDEGLPHDPYNDGDVDVLLNIGISDEIMTKEINNIIKYMNKSLNDLLGLLEN